MAQVFPRLSLAAISTEIQPHALEKRHYNGQPEEGNRSGERTDRMRCSGRAADGFVSAPVRARATACGKRRSLGIRGAPARCRVPLRCVLRCPSSVAFSVMRPFVVRSQFSRSPLLSRFPVCSLSVPLCRRRREPADHGEWRTQNGQRSTHNVVRSSITASAEFVGPFPAPLVTRNGYQPTDLRGCSEWIRPV